MPTSDELLAIIERTISHQHTVADLAVLREMLNSAGHQGAIQLGKYNNYIEHGKDVQIGDRIYCGADAETIREIVRSLLQELQTPTPSFSKSPKSVDELVQQVRSRLHDSIQSLHSTMPLWGIDNWMPLGDIFVDVNILESLSSSRRSELNDLWQDFTNSDSNYRSLDRIGLSKEQQRVSGLSVLERDTNLVVVGKPGSGKTTYLQRIVTECNAGKLQAQRIPLLIKLREFVDDGRKGAYNLEEFLAQLWGLNNTDIELVLLQGRALVLLDGLDEVTGEAGKQIAKEIKRFARAYPQVQVVVTCRTQSQESRFERFDYVEVADFNEQQVRAFAAHWFGTVCGDAGETKTREFLEQLFREENKPIRELAITPILLSLTCVVFQQTGKFYSKRSKLYEEGLELLLVQWDKSREVQRDEVYRDLSVERKLELLSYVAVKKFEQEQYVLFEQEELEGYIGEFLGISLRESRGVLQAIASQHGLLIERAQNVWSFSHLTFQEYLVAVYYHAKAEWQGLVNHVSLRYWQEVFLLTVDMIPSADNLLLLMKTWIDRLLAEEQVLQQLLIWIHIKALKIDSYKSTVNVRAFYLSLAMANIIGFGQAQNGHLALVKNNTLVLVLDGALALDIYKAFKHEFTTTSRRMKLDRELTYILVLTFVLTLNINGNDLNHQIDINLKRSFEKVLEYTDNSKLEQILQTLKIQLPAQEDNHKYEAWWKKDGLVWADTFRTTIINYLNIGHHWQFNDFQRLLLRHYYVANTCLVTCLNNSYFVTNKVRQEIEETLLLPLAEIEKRKRDK